MRAFRRVRYACFVIAFVCTAYLLWLFGLNLLAVWAEASANAYPYRSGENALRFLLPSVMNRQSRARIMLTGPSAAAEAFLYEDFELSFPGYDAYQASFSTATLDDVLVALDYIERVYGPAAMPEVMIVGGEPRFFANIPRRFGSRKEANPFSPLLELINRYSPHFRVEETPEGSILIPKTMQQKLGATFRFWARKQQPRQRVALAAALDQILNGRGQNIELVTALPAIQNIEDPLARASAFDTLRFMASVGPYTAFRYWLPAYISPYVTHYRKPLREKTKFDGFSGIGHWDPSTEAELIRSQVGRLVAVSRRGGTKLFVVMVPEHPINRTAYPSVHYDAFKAMITSALDGTPFLDLRTFLGAEAFMDDVHVGRDGAHRVTAEVVRFIESEGGVLQ